MKVIPCIPILISIVLFTAGLTKGQNAFNSSDIDKQLKQKIKYAKLYYPNAVKRAYTQNGFEPIWIKPKTEATQALAAMMLLDCVLQYGLAHSDYHPKELVYDKLHSIINAPENVTNIEKADFDITLTDALLALINHLHYGKLNPKFPAKKVDALNDKQFNAVSELLKSIQQQDLIAAILTVQPKFKAYVDLQNHMKLVKGQYAGDCYEIPEADVRKIAINMERLRWIATGKTNLAGSKRNYLTCEVKDGILVFYKDVHNLDPLMEAAMYGSKQLPPSKKKQVDVSPVIKLKKD